MDLGPVAAAATARHLIAGYLSHAGDSGKHHVMRALRTELGVSSSSVSSQRQLLSVLQKQLATDGCAAFHPSKISSIKVLLALYSCHPVSNRQVDQCLLSHAKIFLESRLRTSNPATLKLMLERTIELVTVTELQSIPLAILEGFKEIPENCLRTLIDTKTIMVLSAAAHCLRLYCMELIPLPTTVLY